jgi:hypothetical protein
MKMFTTVNTKFWNITVFEKGKTIFTKRCVSVKEANELLKIKREEYPSPPFIVYKEYF